MVIMFALAAAVLYGSADFLGGAASRHSRALSVAALSVPVGALVMLGAAVVSVARHRAPGWAGPSRRASSARSGSWCSTRASRPGR